MHDTTASRPTTRRSISGCSDFRPSSITSARGPNGEKQDFFDYALTDFVRKLLPVLDAFERGLEVAEGETVADFKRGFQLVLKQFKDVLAQAGLESIDTSGQIFDPNRHQALMREETEAFADNQITGELQPGYTFKGRLLRPSLVKVAAAPDKTTTETQSN